MSERLPAACEERKDDLVALALGEHLGSREAAVRAHAAACEGCKAYLAAMSGTLDAVRALPAPEPSAALTDRILAAARAADASSSPDEEREGILERRMASFRALFRRPLLASAVAAVTLAVVAVAILVLAGRGPERAGDGAGKTPVVARLENRGPSPASPPRSFPEPRASPLAVTESSGESTASNLDRVALDDHGNDQAEPGHLRVTDDAPAEDPILATITGVPAAGAPTADDEEDQDRSAPVARIALAQPAEHAPGRPRESAATHAVPTTPAAPAAPARAGGAEGETVIDGDVPQRFFVGRDISTETGREQAGSASRGTDRVDGVDTPANGQAVVTGVVADVRGESERQEAGDSSVAADAYRQPTRTASAEQAPPAVAPGAAPAPPPPPPASPVQPSIVAYGGVGEAPGVEEAEAFEVGYSMDEYSGLGAASVVSSPEVGGSGGSPAAPPPPPPADDVETARRRLGEGRAAEAETILEDALRGQVVRAADTTFLLAETYARQGKWSDAARTYELFLARYLDDPRADEARWRAAEAYRRTGASTRAAALLGQLVGVPGYDSRARTVLDELAAQDVDRAAADTAVETTSTEIPAAAPAEPSGPAGAEP